MVLRTRTSGRTTVLGTRTRGRGQVGRTRKRTRTVHSMRGTATRNVRCVGGTKTSSIILALGDLRTFTGTTSKGTAGVVVPSRVRKVTKLAGAVTRITHARADITGRGRMGWGGEYVSTYRSIGELTRYILRQWCFKIRVG